MLLYRVFLYDPAAAPGDPGHPAYIHRPQGASRWDNPYLYDAWYLATSPEGAVGETFGNLSDWSEEMFMHPTGMRRALAIFAASDDLSLFDFDDAKNLQRVGMRPSQVVIRNKGFTQLKAVELFEEQERPGSRRWAGVSWWSFHRPVWCNVMLWQTSAQPAPISVVRIEELALRSPAVLEAAEALSRPLR